MLTRCVNKSRTVTHRLDSETGRTLCGLVWRPNGRGDVVIPSSGRLSTARPCGACKLVEEQRVATKKEQADE